MKSLILTVLYLAKDTIHRWFTRVSSPLARILVVFFLVLCALCFLGSYVISAKVVRDKIRSSGGDIVAISSFPREGQSLPLPTQEECSRMLNSDSVAIRSAGHARLNKESNIPLLTYDFNRAAQMMPLLAPGGGPTLLCTPESGLRPGPADVSVQHTEWTLPVRILPAEHLLFRATQQKMLILVPPDVLSSLTGDKHSSGMVRLLLRLKELNSSADLHKVENTFRCLARLEGIQIFTVSAAGMLEELDIILGNQTQCRATFCLGIAGIVGILLTALAGMEYRQNEYIYTLMKSFGIHPLLLVGSFIAENLLLVGCSFAAALAVFMQCQRIIVAQFFKMGHYSLSLAEIMPEIQLICATLLLCVLISSLPIIVATHREIGRVLK